MEDDFRHYNATNEKGEMMNLENMNADNPLLQKHFVENVLKEVNTVLIASIVEFNPATQRAVVSPLIREKEILSGGKSIRVQLPQLFDVPVFFPFSPQSGFSITYPVRKGDYCLVVFSQRDILNWKRYGSVQDTNEVETGYQRMFDLNDGFAFVGFSPLVEPIKSFQNDAVEIRNEDRNIYICLNDQFVEIKDVNKQTRLLMAAESISLSTMQCKVVCNKENVLIDAGPNNFIIDNNSGTITLNSLNSVSIKSNIIALDGNVACSNGATGTITAKNVATVVDGIVVAIV